MRYLFAMLLAVLTGCGAGAALKHTIEGSFLGDVPPEEKGAIFEAMAEVNKAQDEVWRAQHQVSLVERDLAVAEGKLSQAETEVDQAQVEREYAAGTKDQSRIAPAEKSLTVARLAVEVAEARRELHEARREHARAGLAAAERLVLESGAKVELARAQLAVKKAKKPTEDFELATFERQAGQANRSWLDTKAEADKLQLEIAKAEAALQQLEARLEQARGPAAN